MISHFKEHVFTALESNGGVFGPTASEALYSVMYGLDAAARPWQDSQRTPNAVFELI